MEFSRLKSILNILIILIAVLIVPSCAKDNNMGKLRGQWQLMTIERPGAETFVPQSPRLYMSFDQGLLQLTTSSDEEMFNRTYIARVVGEEPDLTFEFPYDGDAASMVILSTWGIDENPATVKVITLDNKSLVMLVGDNMLTLRRF